MSVENDKWKSVTLMPLHIRGDRASPDTKGEFIPGGWWQRLDSDTLLDLEAMINNDQEDMKLVDRALIYLPPTIETAVVRLRILEDETKRHRVTTTVSFAFNNNNRKILDMEIVDPYGYEVSKLGWGRILTVFNLPIDVNDRDAVYRVNNVIEAANNKLVHLNQPRMPFLLGR